MTTEAASAGGQPRRRRKRAKGQVSVVISRPMTRGHTIDHIRPSSQIVTAVPKRTSSSSADMRAEARSAARVLAGLREADMPVTLGPV
ncbi:hypothetical protein SNE510_76820 [Streptomyces sp. NE5-10]|nr:hypothetical protein SNE510_76820 [Streptomyces sp. NE5-10]